MSNDKTVVWLGAAVFIGSFLRIWQGLDFTDMGYWLTGYQQLYTFPQGIGGGIVNWLTYFIGYSFGALLGGTVLSYRLGYALVVTLSAVLSYLLLSKELGRSRVLAAVILLTALYAGKAIGNWVGYNNLTALFYLVGASLLYHGLVNQKLIWIVVVGAVLGANVFVRLPNVLGLLLVSAICLYAFAEQWSWRKNLLWSAWFGAGFLVGLAIIWLLIVMSGHDALYLKGIDWITDMAADDGSSHSGGGLIKLFLFDQALACAYALLTIIVGLLVANWIVGRHVLIVSGVMVLLTGLLFGLINHMSNGYSDSGKWAVTGLCYILLMIIVVREFRNNISLSLMAFIAGLILFIAPLGSNNGIANAKYGLWLALPLCLMWLWQGANLRLGKFTLKLGATRLFAGVIMLALSCQTLIATWRYTYNDSQDRTSMQYGIAHPLLIGTYTTKERAKVVGELLVVMKQLVKPSDELLAYNQISMLHFLTETHPYLDNSWLEFYSPKKLDALLREKEMRPIKLPIIVRAKGNTSSASWPVNIQYLNRREARRQVFEQFERKHGYVLIWANEFFEVLQPS
ncbi:MAG: hypothetical protein HOO95_00360 [Gallionella sp.]|nr:hypothetical protein [Gallionella sp.]